MLNLCNQTFILIKYSLIPREIERERERHRNLTETREIRITFFEWFMLRVLIIPSLFTRLKKSYGANGLRSLLHSNSEPLAALQPIEREENNPQRFFAAEEKAFGNFIQTNGVSRGTGSFGKKSNRHGFVARAIFPSDGGKVSHWLVPHAFSFI